MHESFEMLPYGGDMEQSEVQRQLPRLRGGARPLPRPVLSRRPATLRTAGRPHKPQPLRGPWYPRPLFGSWSYPWPYPSDLTLNVFDDDGAPVEDGLPQEELHPMACHCGACSGTAETFDVLPFMLKQQAAVAGRVNWRARRA